MLHVLSIKDKMFDYQLKSFPTLLNISEPFLKEYWSLESLLQNSLDKPEVSRIVNEPVHEKTNNLGF